MNLKFKRRYLTYVSYAAVFGLFVNALKNFDAESIRTIDYLTILGLLFLLSSLIWSVFHPYFMIVSKDKITIYDEFFIKRKIIIDEIKRVDEAVGIVSKTVFEMNTGKKVKFTTSNLRRQDLKKLADYLTQKNDSKNQTD